MKKCILLTTLAVYLFTQLTAQNLVNLQGAVVDNSSHAIAGAVIHVLNTNLQTTTDADGRFIFNRVPPGKYTVEASALGFAIATTTITTNHDNNAAEIRLQPEAKQLDEVIVTAQKREETNQQLPISITALSSKKIADYRIWNTKDITAIVPNLYSADPGDKRNVTAIRGIATTSYDQAVATYIDGVNQFGLDTYISPMFDVDRIEVLRGPQGTLYGRNAMGGVVNIITKQPTNHFSGFAEASVGNYGLQRYTAGIKVPLVKDKLYFGAAGLYEGSNGFYTNDFNNTHYDKQHSIGGNYYLKFIASKQWSFTVNAKNISNRNGGPFPLVADRDEAFSNAYHVNQNATTKLIDDLFNASFSINYAGRYFNVTSQTAYQYNYRIYDQPIDGDFSPFDAISIINNYGKRWNTVKVWTQELRFSSPASATSPFKWVAGGFYFNQHSPVRQATHFGVDASLIDPSITDSNFALRTSTTTNKFGSALYGQITYAISKKFNIVAGIRYDHEQQDQDVFGDYLIDGMEAPVFNFRSDTSGKVRFNAWSPKFGIDYSINKSSLLFATYSKGYRAGGLTPLSSDPSQPPLYPFKPEYSNNIEAGIKNSLANNKLLLNITAFYTKVTDAQVPTLELPDAVTITKNTGKLTSKGLEAEASAIIAKGLTADYSFGYTHATYNNLKVSSNGSEENLKGKRQVFTPNKTSMLALQYTFDAGSKTSFAIRGEWRLIGKQYFDLANTIAQNQYSLFNAQATIAYKQVSLRIWSRNIADKKYIAYAYDFGAIHLGDPATYGATVQVKF